MQSKNLETALKYPKSSKSSKGHGLFKFKRFIIQWLAIQYYVVSDILLEDTDTKDNHLLSHAAYFIMWDLSNKEI